MDLYKKYINYKRINKIKYDINYPNHLLENYY